MDDENNDVQTCMNLWWTRITKQNVDYSDINSVDKNVSQMDHEAFLRGRWNNSREFLFSSIGLGIGLNNIWMFPLKVQMFGGSTFIILYFFFSFTFGLSMILLEMGLGQFTSMSTSQTYKCVPILFGIGWSQVITSIIMLIYYGVVLSWVYSYIFGCFKYTLPWSSCNNTFNSPKCHESNYESNYESSLNKNETFKSSYYEFLYRYVLGVEKLNGELYTMDENMGPIEWHRSTFLFIVWLLAFLSVMYGIKSSSKVAYFTALFPYLPLTLLFILGCTLPGGGTGLLFYIKPNMRAFIQPITYIKAFEHTLYSIGVGAGVYSTLSSHNNFYHNFLRDGICVVIVDCATSFFSGLVGFTFIGYLAHKNNKTIENALPAHGFRLYFMVYPEALTTVSGSNFFTLLFMLATLLLGMDSHFIMLESAVTSFTDEFVKPDKIFLFRVIFAIAICTLGYLLGLLLITPGGVFYLSILDKFFSFYVIPMLGLFQCITIGLIYGIVRFSNDIKMMLGFPLPKYLVRFISFFCPFVLLLIILNRLILGDKHLIYGKPINQLGYIVLILIFLIPFLPLFIGVGYIIILHHSRYETSTLDDYMQSFIKPPIYFGPRYKINWLSDKEYKEKFQKYRKHREFLEHVSPFENIKIINRAIKEGQSPFTVYKKQSTKIVSRHKTKIHKVDVK